MAKSDNYRSKTHMLLLYPEDSTHVEALEKIKLNYEYAYILHDKDVYSEDGETYKAGDLKKAHYHVVIRTNNSTWQSAIAKDLGITDNYVRKTGNFENALMYLIHYNDIDKTQYNITEVQGPLVKRLKEAISKGEKSEGEKVTDLIDYIESCAFQISMAEFARYCAANGYWAEFRRSGVIFLKILEEHNKRYI